MFNVLFWFQIDNMSHSLEIKIPVVNFMAKYESPAMKIRDLQQIFQKPMQKQQYAKYSSRPARLETVLIQKDL